MSEEPTRAPEKGAKRKTDYGDFTEYEVRCLKADYCRDLTVGTTGWGLSFIDWLEIRGIAKHIRLFRLQRIQPKFGPGEIPAYVNPHLSGTDLEELFKIDNVPATMLRNHQRLCFLKLVPGMANPRNVQHRGVPVTPVWDSENLVGDQPRVFRIEGFQKNYRGDPCYRIHQVPDDTFGRCASPQDVIVVSEYAVTTPPTWHQRRAGHAYGSILRLWMTDEEAVEFRSKIDDDRVLHSRNESPHIWTDAIPKMLEKPTKKKK